MNLNQEFHEHLQAGRIADAIALVIGQLVELKITTKANSGRLHTTVNLLSGQITNTVDPAFFSDKASQKLLEFHTNQITATSQVVREQLRSLQDLLQALTPAATQENIKPIPLASGESSPRLSLSKQAITEGASVAIESVSIGATTPPVIISTQTSETQPVALAEVVPSIRTPSIAEKSDGVLAPEEPISQPEPLITKTPRNPPIPQEPLGAKTSEHSATTQPQVTKDSDHLQVSEPEKDFEITAADSEPMHPQTAPAIPSSASEAIEQKERVKLPETSPTNKPESRVGIASGLAAVLAQTSAFDPSEAAAIPNKFDQALRSAGVRSTTEEDLHPFVAHKAIAETTITQSVIEHPTELIPRRELIDLLQESEDDWDEWLLEEDNILSELSDVTKDRLPDLESHWLSASASSSAKSAASDWEEFMPEYPEVNTIASKNQANVERFRQNLVNDPQLMSELLAELDDLEEEDKLKH
jgi:hypothetical protein